MPRKLLRKFLPSHDAVRTHPHLARFGRFLHHPNLWHLNRKSVSSGLALGLFAAYNPLPMQMLTAAILAIFFRVNLPVAVAATWITNPVTTPFLFALAYWLGSLFTGQSVGALPPLDFDWHDTDWSKLLPALFSWVVSLGPTFLLGLLLLASLTSLLGYLLSRIGWRLYVLWYWRRRQDRVY